MPLLGLFAEEAPERQGIKRKLFGSDRHMELEDVGIGQDACAAKRQCNEMFPDPTDDNGVVICHDHGRFLHPCPQPLSMWQNSPHALNHRMQEAPLAGCQKYLGVNYNTDHSLFPSPIAHRPLSPTPVENAPSKVQFSMMAMDGELYNPSLSNMDLEAAICNSSMSSDFSPNPTQYCSPSYLNLHNTPHNNNNNNDDGGPVEKCSINCQGGFRSPVSNAIRCGCTSSWQEGNGNHYVSDYY